MRGMLNLLFTLVLLNCFFTGCSRAPAALAQSAPAAPGVPAAGAASVSLPPEKIYVGPRFVLSGESARPGEPVTVFYSDNSAKRRERGLQAALLNAEGKRLARAVFFRVSGAEEKISAAIFAVPSTAVSGKAAVRIEDADGIIRDLPFTIESREFASETIPLNQSNTDIRTAEDPQKTAESEHLWAIISRTGTDIYAAGRFSPPVTSTRRTSHFGDRRVYEYADGGSATSVHAGVDYGIPTGTSVRAAARGRVVLARSRIVTGNSVVLEHLPGVYSLYYHLSKIAVTEGSVVEQGVLLGESGSTGLSTGPHLHWEVRVSTENADPDFLLSHSLLDKNDIIHKMKNQE